MILQINWAPILLVRLFLEYQLRLRFSLELYGSGVLKGWGKSTLQRPVLCPSSPAIHETTLIPAVCVYMPVRRIGLRPDDSNISDTSIDNCGTTWKKTLMQEKKKKKNHLVSLDIQMSGASATSIFVSGVERRHGTDVEIEFKKRPNKKRGRWNRKKKKKNERNDMKLLERIYTQNARRMKSEGGSRDLHLTFVSEWSVDCGTDSVVPRSFCHVDQSGR